MPKGIYKRNYDKCYTLIRNRNISKALKGKPSNSLGTHWKMSELGKENIGKAMIGNKNALGVIRSTETRAKMSKANEKKWQNPEYRLKVCEGVRKASIRLWQDSAHWRKMMKAFAVKPNKPEIFLTKLLDKILPNEYKYVGDGQFILGGKCPDFLNINGKKKLIEFFGDYWHSKKITGTEPNQHEKERMNYFKQFGFDTLVIWESELNNKNLKNKILKFNVL